jgi:tripartite-type tricarboxylate transporter receptor subunit TctC
MVVPLCGKLIYMTGESSLLNALSHSQSFPSKTIRIIEPAGPGSAVDSSARDLAPRLTEALGQQVIIANRPGANSAIGAREAARAPADGHTLFHGNINNALNDCSLTTRVAASAKRFCR